MPSHDERLRVPWWWWLVGGAGVFSVFIVYLVWTPLWVATGIGVGLTAALVVGLVRYGRARVTVDDAGLRAGRTRLPGEAIGEIRALDEPARRRLLGPDANARAYTLVRGYIPGGVYVQVHDVAHAADSIPYWFVSSRRPDQLAAALTRVAKAAR